MKIKLLKKIRSNYVILKRNNEYSLVTLDHRYDDLSGWTTLKSCIDRRREYILNDARKYKKHKTIVKSWNKNDIKDDKPVTTKTEPINISKFQEKLNEMIKNRKL